MVAGDHVNGLVCQGLFNRGHVRSASQRGIHFGVGIEAAHRFIGQREVMRSGFQL